MLGSNFLFARAIEPPPGLLKIDETLLFLLLDWVWDWDWDCDWVEIVELEVKVVLEVGVGGRGNLLILTLMGVPKLPVDWVFVMGVAVAVVLGGGPLGGGGRRRLLLFEPEEEPAEPTEVDC